MQVSYATAATPGRPNEDCVVAGPTWAAVLDGATMRPGTDPGCVHSTLWYVRHLAGQLAQRLAPEPGTPLADLLADAIEATSAGHAGTCDLANPDSPSATVALVRATQDRLDWLVLADSAVLVDRDGHIEVTLDDRTSHLPSYTTEAVRALRNHPAGFWVAGTRPEAAYEALTGSAPLRDVRRAGVLTDGATRLVERFGELDWPGLLDLLHHAGPAEVIRRTRTAESAEPPDERRTRRGKPHDDATALFLSDLGNPPLS